LSKNSTTIDNATIHDHHTRSTHLNGIASQASGDLGKNENNATKNNETVPELPLLVYRSVPVTADADDATKASNISSNSTNKASDNTTSVDQHHHVQFRLANETNNNISNKSTPEVSTNSTAPTVKISLESPHDNISSSSQTKSARHETVADLSKNTTVNANATLKEDGNEKNRPVNPKFKGIYDKLRSIFK